MASALPPEASTNNGDQGSADTTNDGTGSKEPPTPGVDDHTSSGRTFSIKSLFSSASYSLFTKKEQFGWEMLPLLLTAFLGSSNLSVFSKQLMFHGGACYLVPYFMGLIFFTMPVVFMEAYVGQFTRTWPFKSYQYFAPVLIVVVSASVVSTSIGSIQALLNMILSFQMLIRYGSHKQWTKCDASNSPTCISFHNDRECFKNSSQIGIHYLYKECRPAYEAWVVEPTRTNIPAVEYLYSNVTIDCDNILHFGEYNIEGFAISAMIIITIFALLMLPIRFYAYTAVGLQLLAVVLLVALAINSNINTPIDLPSTIPGTFHFKVRWAKLMEWGVWRSAFMLSVRSLSLAQTTISSVSIYTKRTEQIVKWVILASLCDLGFSVLMTIYFEGLMKTMRGIIASQGLNPYDFDRNTHVLLHGLTLQILSYYQDAGYMILHCLFVFIVILNSYLSMALMLHQTACGIFSTNRRWLASIIAAAYSIGISIFFFFENSGVLFGWFARVRSMLAIATTAIYGTYFLAGYGLTQVRVDCMAMNGVPKTWIRKFWARVTDYTISIYGLCALPISVLIIGSSMQLGTREIPFDFMQNFSGLYFILSPPGLATIAALIFLPIWKIYKTKGKWFDLFHVQQDLPSYRHLRESPRTSERGDQGKKSD